MEFTSEYNRPLVSVCITAYNIEHYLAEAIDSVLSQEIDFSYEIVIGEDRSTDGTLAVCRAYADRYPNVIRLIENPKNLGNMMNLVKSLEQCKGKYLAVLDGDDVWLDKHKLQKQVDLMENDPDCFLCFHDAYISNSKLEPYSSYGERFAHRDYSKPFTLKKVVQWNVIGPTSSIVYRNFYSHFPDWVQKTYGPEVLLFFLCVQRGSVLYIPEKMSVYRVHAASTDRSFSKIKLAKRNIMELTTYYHVLYPQFRFHYVNKLLWNRAYLAYQHFIHFQLTAAFLQFFQLLPLGLKYLIFYLGTKKIYK